MNPAADLTERGERRCVANLINLVARGQRLTDVYSLLSSVLTRHRERGACSAAAYGSCDSIIKL